MAKQARVEISLSLSEYTSVYADKLAQSVNVKVRRFARQFVAVGPGPEGGRLRNSIRTEKLGPGNYRTFAETPYAAAQEFGRPDLIKYTFTPYMRPAAQKATQTNELQRSAEEASNAAAKIAKR